MTKSRQKESQNHWERELAQVLQKFISWQQKKAWFSHPMTSRRTIRISLKRYFKTTTDIEITAGEGEDKKYEQKQVFSERQQIVKCLWNEVEIIQDMGTVSGLNGLPC